MKKVVIYLLILLFTISGSNAIYQIKYSCEEILCLGGSRVNFDILLVHPELNTKYISIDLINYNNNETIAASGEIDMTVTPQSNGSLSLFGVLPENTRVANVLPCFTITPLDENLEQKEQTGRLCGASFFTIDIISSDLIDCISSQDCYKNEECIDNLCLSFICNEREYIDNHECIALNCTEKEYMENNECKKLKCDYGEYAENHECKELRCGMFQKIEENTCALNTRLLIKIFLALGVIGVVSGILYVKLKLP
ncbi:hypothetical protein HQ529_04990 [Candidatus Woesearchaeota archaeon]|nr:hypothetical protein [Candidatus Woesearchaeota archaeon]